jgi:hypothetical protein
MHVTLKLKEITFTDTFLTDVNQKPLYPGVDGAVIYEVTVTRTHEEVEEFNRVHEGQGTTMIEEPWTFNLYQPFKTGNLCQIEGRNVWKWDGNREHPTISPSFLCDMLADGFRIHLFLIAGKIDLLSDSTVTLVQ